MLYSRARGLSGNDGSIHQWDISGTGAPVSEPNIPGPVGANSFDFDVDPLNNHAYMEDGGGDGFEITRLSDGSQTLWQPIQVGGAGDSVASLEGSPYVYYCTVYGSVEQFSQTGVPLLETPLPNAPNEGELVITPNGNLFATAGSNLEIVGITTLNPIETTHLVFKVQPSDSLSGSAINPSVAVEVVDPAGNVVTTDNSNVTVSLAGGSGTLGGTLTVAAFNGVATFSNLSVTGNGACSLNAADASYGSVISKTFNVSIPSLAFVQQPTDGTVGAAVSPAVTVQIQNASGQRATGDNSNVTLALASGSGSLLGTLTVAAHNGLATFSNLSLSALGAHTLRATDGADLSATSNSFNETGPSLAFIQQPGNTPVGMAISPAVTVEIDDANGHRITTDSSTVTLTLASGAGALNGTLSSAAVNGLATFSNLSLSAAGAHTLLATDGTDGSATSTSFNATVPSLAFVQQPTAALVGASISPSVTVEVLDANGHLLSSDDSSVTLALASGIGALDGTVTTAAHNGIATFTGLSISARGTHSLTATDGIYTAATSNSFVIGVPYLVFVQNPTSAAPGATIAPALSVEILDQDGHPATADNSNITLTLGGDGTGNLGGTLTVAAQGGIASFNDLSIDTAGAYTLTASDGTYTPTTTSDFMIAVPHLVFMQQPGDGSAGALGGSVTVAIEDPNNQVISTAAGDITLTVDSGPSSTISGTVTVQAVGGVATFDDLSIPVAGSYTLSASAQSAAPAVSTGVNITPGPAAQLGFVQQPTETAAGAIVGSPVTVAVEDSYGNVITTDRSHIRLSLGSGPAHGVLRGAGGAVKVHGGIATFSRLSFKVAGDYTIVARDGVLTAATSNSFTIDPGGAVKMLFIQQPTTTPAGQAFNPPVAVELLDRFKNVVTNDDSAITLSFTPTSEAGDLTGTSSIMPADGIATFSDMEITAVGRFKLIARQGALTSVSRRFTVAASEPG
jgi:hypothetical protein